MPNSLRVGTILLFGSLVCGPATAAGICTDESPASQYGVFEVRLTPGRLSGNPFFENRATVTFTRPNGSKAVADAFYDGRGIWKARAYCDHVGTWRWRSNS